MAAPEQTQCLEQGKAVQRVPLSIISLLLCLQNISLPLHVITAPAHAGKYGEDLSGGYYESGGSSLKLGAVRCGPRGWLPRRSAPGAASRGAPGSCPRERQPASPQSPAPTAHPLPHFCSQCPRSAYPIAFMGASALCFPDGFAKAGLSQDLKFKLKWGAGEGGGLGRGARQRRVCGAGRRGARGG